MASGWGGISDIIEEERKRKEEEAKREAMVRALQQRQQGPRPEPKPLPNPWQAPVFQQPTQSPIAVAQPSPMQQVERPQTNTGPADISSGNNRNDTVQSQLPQSPMPGVQPRPMDEGLRVSLSDRLRDPYNAPNRPMVPTQAQGPAANPWQVPTFGQTNVPRYELQSDEPYTGQNLRRQIMGAQPDPVQDRIGQTLNQWGQTIGEGAGAVRDWWMQQPAYQMAQAREQERRGQPAPSILDASIGAFQNAGGATNPMLSGPAALVGAGFGALGQTDWGKEAGNLGLTGLDHIFDVPQHAISDTPIPGINTSIAEFLTPTVTGTVQALGNLDDFADPTKMGGTNANLLQWLSVYTGQQIGKSQDLRKQVKTLVDQGQQQANLALYNMSSGADATQATLDLLVGRDEKVAQLQQMGVAAQENGNPVQAGEYFRQAQELQGMSYTDMVDQYTSPLASIAYGIVFDPTNFVGPLTALVGLAPEAQAARRAAKATNISDADAIARLTQAAQSGKTLRGALTEGVKEAQKAYNGIVAPFQGVGEKAMDMTWLLARTPESKAAMDTEQLWQGLTGILSGITNKRDVQIVMDTLLTEPGKLVQGIGNLSQEAMQRLSQSDGFARWGAGLVGQNDFVRRMPLLGMVRDELFGMKSLAGEGLVNPYEFYAELHGIVLDAARRANGGKLPKSLPFGAESVDLMRLGPDSAVVTYLNKKGEVIQRGVETTVVEAQRRINAINKAVQDAGKKGAIDYARIPADIQRAIMSDVWLGMRPANWLGNALGATTSLFANDAYTLLPNTQIQDYFGKKFGGVMPNQRLQEIGNPVLDLVRDAKSEMSSGAIDKLAATITRNPDNPISQGMKKLYDIPYGSTEIKLPGGLAIPFGEGAFYSRAFYMPFMRTFNGGIVEDINKNLVPMLQQVEGMTPQGIQRIGDWVTSLAQNGSKSDVAQGIRKLVGKPEIKMTLKEMGVPPELLTPQAARQIEQFISDATPSQAGQVMQEISKVIAGERNPAASVLNVSPTQPGVFDWTDADMAQEAAHMADTMARDAAKAGQDMATATQEATALATQYLQDQKNAYQRVFDDLAGMPNTPDTWSVTMDFWQDVAKTKAKGRSVVDELGKRAVELGTPEAWQQKWDGTKRVYDSMRGELARMGDEARLALADVMNGGTYQPKHDWWDTIENYIGWDEEAFRLSRTVELGSPDAADMQQWQEVIQRNREYIDNSLYELFGSFQRYPSLENFDVVRNGIQKLESMGAQVRYNLDQMLDKLVAGEMSKTAYARARNAAWNNYFDAGVQYNNQLGQAIVRNGVLADAGVDLKWTQDGIEFQLSRPSTTKDKFWARNLSTGAEEEFTVAQTADELTPFTVPKNVVDDYNNLMGNEKALDEATAAIMQEISGSAPEVIRQPMMRIGDRLPGEYPQQVPAGAADDVTVWREPDAAQRVPGYNGNRSAEPLPEDIPSAGDMPDNVVRPLPDDPAAPGYVAPEPVPPVDAPQPVTIDPNSMTKKEMLAQYGKQLEKQGFTKSKLSRMSKGELAQEIEKIPTPEQLPVRGSAKPSSIGDIAKMDAQGAIEARKEMAAAWDREASASLGLPKLDQIVATYNRGGNVNLNLNAGEVKQFEDLYGRTVMGMPIENADDVQRFVQQYVDLKKQADQAQATVANSKQFSKMSAQEIVAQTRDELVAAGYSDDEIRELAKDRRGLLDTVATIRGEDPDEFGLVGYDYQVPSVAQLLGLETPEEVAGNTIRDWIFRTRKTGNNTAPQVGDIAEHTVRSLNDLERTLKARLPEILAGTPNEFTGAQRLRIVDAVLDWLPNYDNQLATAQRVGDRMAGWMMLNYQDRRNFDTIMSLLTPYHYFWSRMPSRVAMAALTKPELVNLYYEMNRSVGLENEQANIPDRLQGTLPNPLYESGIGNARINVMSPLRYAIPAMSYLQPNPFAAEDSPDDTQAQKWAKQYEKWAPGLNLYVQALLDVSDGKFDNYYGDTLNSMMPIAGVPVSTLYQRATGNMPAKDGVMAQFGFGPDTADDGFGIDAYRARRAVSYIGVEEGIDSVLVGYANQVIQNQENGLPVGENIDPAMLDDAIALAQRGVKRAAEDRAVARGTAYGTMMSVSPYPQSEVDMRNAQAQWGAAGYNADTNPYGSKELQGSIIEAEDGLPVWWAKGSKTPGVDATLSGLYDKRSELNAQKKQAEQDAVNALNLDTASRGDIYDAREQAGAPFKEQIDAIGAQIDELKAQKAPSNSSPTRGMSPQEVTATVANGVLWQAAQLPGKPEYPGDDATRQQWDKYNQERAAYDKAQEQYVIDALTVGGGRTGGDEIGPVNHTKNQAIELWWHFNHDRETPGERARLETLDRESAAYEAAGEAQMQNAKQRVKNGDKLLQQYLDTPAGDERDALKEKDWRYRAVTMAAYNAPTYDALVDKFGQEGLQQYYEAMGKSPVWPGENATEEELAAYYKARNEFDAQYPLRDEVSLWLNGRYSWADQNSSTQPGTYDQGVDYDKAVELFGPRIFEIEREFNQASLDDKWVEWRNAHQADYAKLIGFGEWKKAAQQEPQSMANLPTARWGVNPATANASYATDADRNAYPGGMGPQAQQQPPFDQGNLPYMPTMALGNQGQAQPTPNERGLGASSLRTTQDIAGVNPPVEESTPRTAEEWAMENEKYRKYEQGGGSGGGEWSASWDEYLSLEDNDAKRQYLLDNPEFADEYLRYIREKDPEAEAWWLKERTPYAPRSYTYYGGGGGWGGGGGGGGYSRGGGNYAPQVNPRYMDRGLWESPMQGQRQWIPYSNSQPEWLRAGDRLAPDPIRKWQPPRF